MNTPFYGKHVLIINAYSYRNAGDAAIMIATRRLLNDLGATSVAVSSRYGDGASYRRHGMKVVPALICFPTRGDPTKGELKRLVQVSLGIVRALIVIGIGVISPSAGRRSARLCTPQAYRITRHADCVAIAGGGYMYSSKRVSLTRSAIFLIPSPFEYGSLR